MWNVRVEMEQESRNRTEANGLKGECLRRARNSPDFTAEIEFILLQILIYLILMSWSWLKDYSVL